jgi:hypothetical protein
MSKILPKWISLDPNHLQDDGSGNLQTKLESGGALEATASGIDIKDAGVDADRLASGVAGNGLTGGAGSALAIGAGNGITVNADDVDVDPSALITGGTAEIDGDKLDIDWTPSNYTPSTSPSEADNEDNLTAHLYGIDQALAASGAIEICEMHLVTSGEVTAGYFSLSQNPVAASIVQITPVGGPEQVNKQNVGATGATPDFDVLNTSELHFNNNGSATGLSEEIEENDILLINYEY